MTAQLFFVGVKGLIYNSEGKILLLLADVSKHRKNTKPYWDIPGGRIEGSDGLVETLHREIKEETGVTEFIDEPKQLTTVISNHRVPTEQGEVGLALVVYKVSIADETPIRISEEHERYEWVGVAEAVKRLSNKYPQAFTDTL